MNSDKAIRFVRDKGNQVEQARLQHLLTGAFPTSKVIAEQFAGQRADGGWSPFWAREYSSLDATCFRLAKAEQLGIPPTEPSVALALRFLAQRQLSDGSWEEDQRVADSAPPWARPGELAARLYLTANCGFWLALLDGPGPRTAIAGDLLQGHLGVDGRLPGFLHTHWLAAGLWYKIKRPMPAERVLQYLEHSIGKMAPSNLAWLLSALAAAGVSPMRPLMVQAASALEQLQQKDGRWPSEDGVDQDVHTTLEAMWALWLCGENNEEETQSIAPRR